MRKQQIPQSAERWELFVRRAHELLEAGYQKMSSPAYNGMEEPEITGELALQIEKVLREKKSPWQRPWSVHEDEPENQEHLPVATRKKGKRRKRPDIKLRFSGQRENLYLRFEAKLLTDSGAYEDLIGSDPKRHALARFLQRRYGRDDDAGGLLGYVQVGTEQEHSHRVQQAFSNEKRYRITVDGAWTRTSWKRGPTHCFRTKHWRDGTKKSIAIFHTYLLFR